MLHKGPPQAEVDYLCLLWGRDSSRDPLNSKARKSSHLAVFVHQPSESFLTGLRLGFLGQCEAIERDGLRPYGENEQCFCQLRKPLLLKGSSGELRRIRLAVCRRQCSKIGTARSRTAGVKALHLTGGARGEGRSCGDGEGEDCSVQVRGVWRGIRRDSGRDLSLLRPGVVGLQGLTPRLYPGRYVVL